jgi:hypothetical protein
MGTEQTGFEPEPAFDLAPFAEMELLRERLYAAQNALVRLEGERDGKVREALLLLAAELEAEAQAAHSSLCERGDVVQAWFTAARMARERAQRDGAATAGAPMAHGEQAPSPDAPGGAQRAAGGAP